MATYSKPAKVPRWADTSSNLVEPIEGKKDEGWLYEEEHISSWENWRTNLIGLWFKWLDERLADGVSNDQLVIQFSSTSGKITFDKEGECVLMSRDGAGVNNGAQLWFQNVDRQGGGPYDGYMWQWIHFGPELKLQSYDGNDSIEFTYLVFSPTPGEIIVSNSTPLVPATNGLGKLGKGGVRWGEIYGDKLFFTDQPHLYATLSTNVAVSGGTESNVTPDTSRVSNEITISGSIPNQQMDINQDGKYLFTSTQVIQSDTTQTVNNGELKVYVDTGGGFAEVGYCRLIFQTFGSSAANDPVFTITHSFILDLDDGDSVKITADCTAARSHTHQGDANGYRSKITVTLLQAT